MWFFIDRMTFITDLWVTSALIIVTLQMADSQEQYPILKASQCFKSRTIPKVVFGCPSTNHIIRIVRAFHGLRPRSSSSCSATSPNAGDVPAQLSDPTCSYCAGDCVDDSINEVYDWSSCIGGSSCSRTVLQSYIHSCPARDKFSEYLHVEYQCIPKDNAINICAESKQMTPFGGYLTSPNYPLSYPTNQDCSCTLRADDPNVRMVLSFYDLFLETKNGRCRADWLMLLQEGEKHRHCGVITSSGSKNITTLNGLVTLQFHSNAQDHQVVLATQTLPDVGDKSTGSFYKGFWIHYEAEDKRTTINLLCGPLAPNDPALLEARADSFDDDVIGTGSQIHRNDLMTSPSDGGFIGRTTGKLFNGDVTHHELVDSPFSMTTERDVSRLDDGGDSRSTKRQLTKSSNDGEKRLSLASSSAISSTPADSLVHRVWTLFIFYVAVYLSALFV